MYFSASRHVYRLTRHIPGPVGREKQYRIYHILYCCESLQRYFFGKTLGHLPVIPQHL
jgi:hypothetical protein